MAVGPVPTASPLAVADPPAALAVAADEARALTAAAWRSPADRAAGDAAGVLRSVLGPDPRPGLARLAALHPIDPARAVRLLALVEGVGRALVARGVLDRPELVWRLSPEEIEAAARGRRPPARLGAGRWEPFLAAVVASGGLGARGTPATPGVGAGVLCRLRGRSPGWRPAPRSVLALDRPVPRVAPLLWNAAGVVVAGGGVGAHLFEVARSLGVPAVVGVDLPEHVDDALAAVDGAAGDVWVLAERDRPASGWGA
jgi:hypothetical protein